MRNVIKYRQLVVPPVTGSVGTPPVAGSVGTPPAGKLGKPVDS